MRRKVTSRTNEMDGCDEHRYIYYVIREVVAFAHINVQIMHKIGYIKIILIFRLAASSEYTHTTLGLTKCKKERDTCDFTTGTNASR